MGAQEIKFNPSKIMKILLITLTLVLFINKSTFAKNKPSVFWSPEIQNAVCEWGVEKGNEISRKEGIFGKKITYKYKGMRAKIKHQDQITPFEATIRVTYSGDDSEKCIVRTGSVWLIDDYLEEKNK